ncbi:MAG: carboxypeptidase regulatory-like domain-containing protein [Bryobacteraceae bacterium]
MKGSIRRQLFPVVLLLALPLAVRAQGTRGTITGIVRDTSAAVVPGAAVTITNEETGSKVTVRSLGDGVYLAPQILPGNYAISVEHSGFKRTQIAGLKLDAASTLTQDLTLEVGSVTETMRVTGQSSLVETTSGEVGTTVSLGHVLEMPLVDRNVFNLINLTPGGYFVSTGQSRAYINGGRGWETSGVLDGVGNNRGALGTQNIEMLPPVDSVQEFKVQASNYAADLGRSQGAAVVASTKSGTNAFHGTLYEFLRNDALDAKGWGVDTKPPLRRNNFGGNIGGPIRKNKAFFFYNYDGLRSRTGSSITRDAGLPEWRRGDFSRVTRQAGNAAAVVPIYDPETGTGTVFEPRGNSPFPGNVIPAARLDPVAVKALSFLPNPNRTPDNPFNNAGNWQLNRVVTQTRDYHIGRVDYDWSDNTKMFFRTFFTKPERNTTPYLEGWGEADPEASVQAIGHQNQALNVAHLFSATFFANFAIGFSRTNIPTQSGGCCDTDFAALLGIPNTPGRGFPRLAYGGGQVTVTNIGAPLANRVATTGNWEYFANFTKISGKHTLKYGGQYARYGGNLLREAGAGTFTFDGRFTRGISPTDAAIANTGVNLADLLLGRMVNVANEQQPTLGKRIHYYGAYFQHDWRATTNLTLNLGVRYETETPPFEVADRNANFLPWAPNPLAGRGDIPLGAAGITIFQNRGGYGKHLSKWDTDNWGPRFGFAYRLFGSSTMSIRGGYGIYYGNPLADAPAEAGKEPFAQGYTAAHPIPFRLRDGLPPGVIAPAQESEFTATWGNRGTRFERSSSVLFLDPARETSYSHNFNLTLQRQWMGILFEAGYRGNLGFHLPVGAKNLNRIRPELWSRTDIPARLRRPWTIFTSDQPSVVESNANWGIANYHAFALKIERRFSSGIGWIVAYTHAKQIDNATYVGGTQLGDNDQDQVFYDRRLERSEATGSIANRLVFSPIVDLPFGKGRKWMNRGGVLNAVLGGWQVATMGTLQSGFPFGVTVNNGGRDLLDDPLATPRPNLLKDPNSPNKGQPAVGVRGLQWLDPAAFATPARYTYGTASRTLVGVQTPGMVSFDSLLAKNFQIAERWRAQFRWELFNTFNTPQFARPADTLGAGNFGVVTSAGGRRIMQVSAKLYW